MWMGDSVCYLLRKRVPTLAGKQTDTLHDEQAAYPWSRSVSWCLAEGYWNENQRCPVGPCGLGRTSTFFSTSATCDRHDNTEPELINYLGRLSQCRATHGYTAMWNHQQHLDTYSQSVTINNNNNNKWTIFIELSLCLGEHCKSSLGSSDECSSAQGGCQPSDEPSWLGPWVCL